MTTFPKGWSSNLLLHLLMLIITSTASVQGYQYGRECGVLYSEEAQSGTTLTLMDNDQSPHLSEDYRGSQTGWNYTGSFLVHKGCRLEACNETYFDGHCQSIEYGSYGGELELMGAASVKCHCPRVCSCSEIRMKWKECARGYLAGGCNKCNSYYTDLRGKNDALGHDFADSITSFTLREGCTLKLYDDFDYDGDETIITDPIVANYSGTVKSMTCACDNRTAPPPPPPEDIEKFPPLVQVPPNLDNLTAMLRGEYKDHPGLLAALSSLNTNPDKRRSSKNAYILLLGYTGSGKSSAVNILFDHPNLTRVGDVNSTTSEIHEFRIPMPVNELGLANSELRVIDTPGFGDTRGLEQDAKVFATLDAYLSNHEELRHRVPNIVLIFHKFHDNRFMGVGSKFVQMLAGLSSFRDKLMDESYSNVVFVLSHFCSELKKLQRKPDPKLSQFKAVIENYSTLPRPIILSVAENRADEQHLPMVNGYHKLPNGEYYPRNLFDKMEMVTTNTGDDIGRAVFRTAFRHANSFDNISRVDYALVDEKVPKVLEYLNVITRIVFDVSDTAVSRLLGEAHQGMDTELKSKYPHALQYLQKSLNVWGIHEKRDIPKTSAPILKLLSHLEQSEATLYLLDKGLGISPPPFPSNVVAGQSYNVFTDRFMTTSNLFKSPGTHPSDIGFLVPDSVSCKKHLDTSQLFHILEGREEYVLKRLQGLGVDVEGSVIPPNLFNMDLKMGYNIRSEAFGGNTSRVTAVREMRLFQMELLPGLELSEEFEGVVRSLGKYNSSSHSSVANWTRFFNQYGTHVVGSLYGGGAIQVTVSSNKTFSDELARGLFELLQLGEDISSLTTTTASTNSSNSSSKFMEGVTHSLRFLGGDVNFHTSDLTQHSMEEAARLLSSWRKSLLYYPAMLTTELRLIPMSKVVKVLGREFAEEMEKVSRLHFNATLVVDKGADSGAPPPDRQDTEGMLALVKVVHDSNRQVQELMKEITRLSQENTRRNQELQEAQLRLQQETANRTLQFQKTVEEHKAEIQKLNEAHQKRLEEMMRKLAAGGSKPSPPRTPSCLKGGTKILMADWSQKEIQNVKPGELVLDVELNPTRVMGVSYEFLLGQSFYGFSKEEQFFTSVHIWVGPGNDGSSAGGSQLYVQSVDDLTITNPLLRYLNATKFHEGGVPTRIFHVEGRRSMMMGEEAVEVFRDPTIHPQDTKVYFMQVESPTGTYIANGYATRHEIPPLHLWPHTMGALVQLLENPVYQSVTQFPYSLDSVKFIDFMTDEIADEVKVMLEAEVGRDGVLVNLDSSSSSEALEVIPFSEEAGVESMRKLYNHPTFASIGVATYSKVGTLVAPYLDGERAFKDPAEVAYLQYRLIQVIEGKMPELYELMLKWYEHVGQMEQL